MRHAIGHKWHHLTEIRRTIHTHTWETAIHAIEAISPIVHSCDGPIHSHPLIVELLLLLLLSFIFLGLLVARLLASFLSRTCEPIWLEAFNGFRSLIATLGRLAGSLQLKELRAYLNRRLRYVFLCLGRSTLLLKLWCCARGR